MRLGRLFRGVAAVSAAVAILASCSSATHPNSTGDESLLPSSQPPPAGTPTRSAPGETRGPKPGGDGGPADPSPGSTPTRSTFPPVRYADDAGVGAMARTYLKRAPASELVIEVDFIAGRAPTQAALDHLAAVLRRELLKPDGISVRRDDAIAETRSSYSFEAIEALEARYRDARSGGSRATMYLLYLDGELAEEPNALGVAYKASAAALFIDRIRSAASALVQPGAIERAVVVHEAGHLLALLNIGYQSRHDHEDPQYPHHSRFRDSVMYWAVEDISVVSILSGGPPDDFDRFDRDDLALLRSS